MEASTAPQKAGITLALLIGAVAVICYLPYVLGAASLFVIFPFYSAIGVAGASST